MVSDLSHTLSQPLNPLLYYLFLVLLDRGVIEWLWSVPGKVRNLEEQTSGGVGITYRHQKQQGWLCSAGCWWPVGHLHPQHLAAMYLFSSDLN